MYLFCCDQTLWFSVRWEQCLHVANSATLLSVGRNYRPGVNMLKATTYPLGRSEGSMEASLWGWISSWLWRVILVAFHCLISWPSVPAHRWIHACRASGSLYRMVQDCKSLQVSASLWSNEPNDDVYKYISGLVRRLFHNLGNCRTSSLVQHSNLFTTCINITVGLVSHTHTIDLLFSNATGPDCF